MIGYLGQYATRFFERVVDAFVWIQKDSQPFPFTLSQREVSFFLVFLIIILAQKI